MKILKRLFYGKGDIDSRANVYLQERRLFLEVEVTIPLVNRYAGSKGLADVDKYI